MGLDISLHPKQLLALTSPANEILYGGAVGGGKALALDTPIFTTEGWKTINTLQVGDKVYDEQGEPCNVVAKSKVFTRRPTYELFFDKKEHSSIIADGAHEWVINNKVLTTEEMFKKGGTYNIDMPKALQGLPDKDVPIHPYILGAYINGNGMQDRKQLEGMFLSARCKSACIHLQTFEGGKYYNKDSWYSLLDELGIAKDKHIPEMYFNASYEQRLELIQGIFDVRGTIFSDGYSYKRSTGQVEIYTDTEQMAKDITFLLASLGEKAHWYPRVVNLYGQKWRVRFYPDLSVFKSKNRIKIEEKAKAKFVCGHSKKYITVSSIKKIKSQPTQCIQVDSNSHCFLAGTLLVPTHNSFLMRVASIIWAMECPGIQIYLFRLTRKELDDNHMVGSGGYYDLLANAVNSKFVKINGSKHEIQFRNGPYGTFMNGSVIHLCHCQHEDDKYLYQGAEMAVLMIDESTHFTWSKYTYLRTRVRIPKGWSPPKSFTDKWGTKFFPRILLGSNPGGISHASHRKEFVKIAKPLTITRMPKSRGGMLRQFVPARLDDNPSIDKDEYEGKVMGVGNEAVARMLLDGDWDAVAGGMFDDIWDDSIHMVEPFDIPGDWYVDRSFDWGSTDPFSVGWWAQSNGDEVTLRNGEKVTYPKGTLFRIAEWYGWTGNENEGLGLTGYEIGVGIRRMEETDDVLKNISKVYPGPGDSQVWNNSPKYDSSYRTTIQELNSGYYGSDRYKMFDIFTKADKSEGTRIRGWDILRSLLKNSVKFPKVDRECLYFFNTCETPARIIPTVIRHERKIEDIADKQEDHVLDEIRYRVQHTVQRTRRINTRIG
jgi:ribosomal protein L31